MSRRIDISYDAVQGYSAIARKLSVQLWVGWIYAAAKAAARVYGFAAALATEKVEAARRARRQRATIRALSGLPDHILKDIGLSRDDICSVAIEVSASPHHARPGRIVGNVTSRYQTKDSIAA